MLKFTNKTKANQGILTEKGLVHVEPEKSIIADLDSDVMAKVKRQGLFQISEPSKKSKVQDQSQEQPPA